jgi:hypothetical protein
VGPQTYADVRKIVEAKSIPLVRAFAEVAKATGRKPSTVAVTYYMIARKQAGGKPKSGGKTIANAASARNGSGRVKHSPGAQAILSRVSAAVAELETVVAKQAQEIARLTKESALADRIRKVLRD